MTAAITPIARFTLRVALTVMWTLVLSKLIHLTWSATKRGACWLCNKVSTTKK